MSDTRGSTLDQRELVDFLLGLLPERDAERLDEASIVDDEVAAQLRDAEDDLVDGYVSGALEPHIRARFEVYYLASAHRREKVAFAKRFLNAVDRAATTPSETAGSGPAPVGPAGRFWKRAAAAEPGKSSVRFGWLLMATAASLALACGVLLLEDLQLRRGLSQARSDGAAQQHQAQTLARQADDERSRNQEMARALERGQTSPAARGPNAIPGDSARAIAAMPVAVVLFPQTRSLGPLPAIAVTAGTGRIAFELRLESSEFARYRVLLKEPGANRTVWESGALVPQSVRAASFVSIVVPGDLLTQPHYSFELAGLDENGRAETVGSYAIQIDRR